MPDAIQARRDPLIGRILAGRYGVYGRLGKGAMGTVYLARQAAMDRLVAIKVLAPEVAGDPEAVRFFHNEARTSSRLRHPHTITLYDFGRTDDGRLYLAMEYLDGMSVARLLQRVRWLEPARAVRIAIAVCRSLAEAHAQGIVHRDVKPANVFLCRVGNQPDFVKVLDFGLAKLKPVPFDLDLPVDDEASSPDARVGTPQYASPEQIQQRKVDGRADLYSLGVTLYEMLAGRRPFDATERLQILVQQVERPPPPLPPPDMPEAPEVPAPLANLVWHLLRKRAEDRPPSAEAVIGELERMAPGL